MKVAWGIWVGSVRTKSSADSISNRAEVLGLDAVAILPSGVPVLNEERGCRGRPRQTHRQDHDSEYAPKRRSHGLWPPFPLERVTPTEDIPIEGTEIDCHPCVAIATGPLDRWESWTGRGFGAADIETSSLETREIGRSARVSFAQSVKQSSQSVNGSVQILSMEVRAEATEK